MSIDRLPIPAETTQIGCQDLGSRIGSLCLGFKKQEACVADDQMTACTALIVGPSDPAIPGTQVKGATAPP